MSHLLVSAAVVLSVSGCISRTPFECARDEQCTENGEVGRCEPDGFCSFPDQDCPSGFRYGAASGALAGQCVGAQDGGVGPNLCLDITQLALGAEHTCAIDSGGDVYCWGGNTSGQLGDDTLFAKSAPVKIRTLPRVVEVRSGENHTCARNNEGTVWCWGLNSSGQLGDGSVTSPRKLPVPVNEMANAANISPGDSHTCAVRLDGTAACWGANGSGQLGNGDDSGAQQNLPVAVADPADDSFLTPLTGVSDIVAGATHSCAIVGDAVQCWGANNTGQLGDGTMMESRVPVAVMGLSGTPQSLAAGENHTCALIDGGQVLCWGDNANGQLGDGTTAPSITANPILGNLTVVELAAGRDHTCVRTDADDVYCWGANERAQIGDGDTADISAPIQVLSDATVVGAGGEHNCARESGGSVRCWGSNSRGQLADASLLFSPDPVPVLAPAATADDIVAGDEFTCAVSGGSVLCWGANEANQLGDGTVLGSGTPIAPIEQQGMEPLTAVTSLSAGPQMMCATKSDDTAVCWGTMNGFGSVNGVTSPLATATQVTGTVPRPIVGVFVGPANVFAATSAGDELWCWNDNFPGCKCGVTSSCFSSSSAARAADYFTDVGQIANAESHSCALSSGSVRCIGSNSLGELGDPDASQSDGATPPVAVLLPPATVATVVVAGVSHTCALVASGAVHCWGANDQGQLGDGTIAATSMTGAPAKVGLPEDDAIAIAVYRDQSCAIRSNNELWCWGRNDRDIFRTGTTVTQQVDPVQIAGVTARRVAPGLSHICVVGPDDTVKCWGSNEAGQLGDGRAFVKPTPAATVLSCESRQ